MSLLSKLDRQENPPEPASPASWKLKLAWTVILTSMLISLLPTLDSLRHDFSPYMTLRGSKFQFLALGTENYPIRRGDNSVLSVDLSALNIILYSDDRPDFFHSSPVVLLEDGVPLPKHVDYDAITKGTPGSYTYWNHVLYFVPSAGHDGSSKFSLLYPVLRSPLPRGMTLFQGNVWLILFWNAVISAAFLALFRISTTSKMARSLFMIPVIAYFSFQIFFGTIVSIYGPTRWEYFGWGADTESWMDQYSADSPRPPVYSTFIRLLFPDIKREMVREVPIGTLIADRPDLPLLGLVHAQKLLLFGCILFAGWNLMLLIPAPLVAYVLIWICGHGYLAAEMDFILSETMAQSWMFAICGAFALYLARPKGRHLLLLALLCGLLYQTRSAGIFSFVIFGFAVLFAYFKQPVRPLASIGASSLLLAAIFAAPIVHRYYQTGFITSAPMYADAQIPFALEFATAADIELMPDETAKQFLTNALALKTTVDATYDKSKIVSRGQYLGTNLYKVAHPTADQLGLSGAAKREMFLKVADPLLRKHWKERWQLSVSMFLSGVRDICRFNNAPFPGAWIFFLAVLLMAAIARDRRAWFAVGLTAAHLAHLVIASVYDVPQARYFHASEFLVLIAFSAVSFSAFTSIIVGASRVISSRLLQIGGPGAAAAAGLARADNIDLVLPELEGAKENVNSRQTH